MKKKTDQGNPQQAKPEDLALQKFIQFDQQVNIIIQTVETARIFLSQRDPKPSPEQIKALAPQMQEAKAIMAKIKQSIDALQQSHTQAVSRLRSKIPPLTNRINITTEHISRIEQQIRKANQPAIQKKPLAQPVRKAEPPVQRQIVRPPLPEPQAEDLDLKVLGAGTYNTAFRSGNGQGDLVFKLLKNQTTKTDFPERSVRLWNQVNGGLQPPARLATCLVTKRNKLGRIERVACKGWVCPFVQGVQASDQEMSDKLLDVFNTTGRIVTDATAPKNFVKTPGGEVVCVDIGFALELDQREKMLLVGLSRKPSLTSFDAWKDTWSAYMKWFEKLQPTYPHTITTVKALLFIKRNRPDITNVDFLKQSPQSIIELATAYDEVCKKKRNESKVVAAMARLEQVQSSELEHIKDECRKILREYLMYYGGTLNTNEEFVPYPATQRATPPHALQERVTHVNQVVSLIKQINTADTQEDCFHIIDQAVLENIQRSRTVSPNLSGEEEKQDEQAMHDLLETVQEQGKSTKNLTTLKKNCQKILNDYLISIGAQSDPAGQQLFYFKLKMVMHKIDDKILALIHQIDLANDLTDIKHLLTQFENEIPLVSPGRRDPTSPDSPVDALSASISRCKVMIEAVRNSAQLANTQSKTHDRHQKF